MEIAKLVLEYLTVLLSPQMVAGSVFGLFLLLFKRELRSLLDRVAVLKWGSAELSAPQQPSETVSGRDAKQLAQVPESDSPPLLRGIQVSPDDAKRLEQAMAAERARAYLWEYRFLNLFLVLSTQRVLDWLASLSSPTTVSMYDSWWQAIIPSAEQRRTVLSVLEAHHLVVISEKNLIEVTPKGREYIEWRGPLPQLLPTAREAAS